MAKGGYKLSRVTIKDVAKKSQISVRTVSRVINNHPNVKSSTRERVQKAIEELDFKVNFLARSLKDKVTNQLVVFIDQRNVEQWGAFYSEFIQELYKAIQEKDYRIIVSASNPLNFSDNDGFNLIKHKLCDGAIIFNPHDNDKRVCYLKEMEIPFVLMGDSKHNFNVSSVGINNYNVGYLGMQSLYNKGYCSVAFLLGKEDSIINQNRASGFQNFCNKTNMSGKPYFNISTFEKAYKKSLELLKEHKVKAFFVSGDELALAVYRSIWECGFKIGKDIGVLGIDNLKMGCYFSPPISTIAQPKHEMAKASLNLLIEQITSPTFQTKQKLFSPEYMERNSI